MKLLKPVCAAMLIFAAVSAHAQTDEELFGSGDDDLFGGDSMFEEPDETRSPDALAYGAVFEDGSVKIGGAYDMSVTTYTPLYQSDDDRSLGERIRDTGLSAQASATFTIDARPTQTLRMYTKFALSYAAAAGVEIDTSNPAYAMLQSMGLAGMLGGGSSGFTPSVKEVFTDFSLFDRIYFRAGLHTVSWGTGLFFSPVSDMINTSSINPEDTSAFVNGSLNLRTQITFPGTQNCLWLYVIPDSATATLSSDTSLTSYLDAYMYPFEARRTAFAAKGEFVIGGWELGGGALYKFQGAPKLMTTASGSILNGKVAVFAEGVYSYGTVLEWKNSPDDWTSKTSVFQLTAGAYYTWKTPQITFAAQYYWDGDFDDHQYSTKGNNLAASVSFAKIPGIKDMTATVFGLLYLGKDPVDSMTQMRTLSQNGVSASPYAGILSATLQYSPSSSINLSAGPYLTWTDFSKAPNVALKLSATLGGGKF